MEHQTMTGQSGYHESLTAHELAHQWWGDNVTCKTWSDIWLNEGFATYAECLWEEFKNGASDSAAYLAAILARKPSASTGSVYVPASQTSSVSRIFDSNLSYRKGAWVLHQLRHVVGDSTFFQLLLDYRAAYQGSAATTDDFAAVASTAHGQDLGWFFQEWVYQGGAPIYQFGWDTVNVDGQQYLHAKIRQTQSSPAPLVFTMPVDLRATISGLPETITVWNNAREQWFVAPVDDVPTALQFDPDQWILRTGLSAIAITLGDLDSDNDVDSYDLSGFSECFTGSGGTKPPGCEPVDFDGDGDVDCADYEQFKQSWTDAGSPGDFTACSLVPAASSWGLLSMALALAALGTIVVSRKAKFAEC
jgi:hypothetical protein